MFLGGTIHQYIASDIISHQVNWPVAQRKQEGEGEGDLERQLFWPKWREYCTFCLWAASFGGGERRTLRKGRRKNQMVAAGGREGGHSDFTAIRLQFPSCQSHIE